MSFARKKARKVRKKAGADDKKVRQAERNFRRNVAQAYASEAARGTLTRKQALHNLNACFLLAMHEEFGYGYKRLMRLHDKMQEEFDCITGKFTNVEEIAEFLRDEVGLNIGIAVKDPKANFYRQIEFKAVKQVSAAFLMALHDEFGFGAERLSRAYGRVCDLSDRVLKKEIAYEDIHIMLLEVMAKGMGNITTRESA